MPELVAHLFDNWDWLKGATLKVGVCHGTANAKRVMEDIKAGGRFSQCHFIEFMACPGGCLGGGGQPTPTSPAIRAARAKAIYAEDRAYDVRKSHENPALLALYERFLTDGPCGATSHHLLHTHLHAARQVHRVSVKVGSLRLEGCGESAEPRLRASGDHAIVKRSEFRW